MFIGLSYQGRNKEQIKRHRLKFKCQYVYYFFYAYFPQLYSYFISSFPGKIRKIKKSLFFVSSYELMSICCLEKYLLVRKKKIL
jgi:hypothetical protein